MAAFGVGNNNVGLLSHKRCLLYQFAVRFTRCRAHFELVLADCVSPMSKRMVSLVGMMISWRRVEIFDLLTTEAVKGLVSIAAVRSGRAGC